jgi:hypothetical protein
MPSYEFASFIAATAQAPFPHPQRQRMLQPISYTRPLLVSAASKNSIIQLMIVNQQICAKTACTPLYVPRQEFRQWAPLQIDQGRHHVFWGYIRFVAFPQSVGARRRQ